MTLAEFRAQNPAYKDWSDDELADALHQKYYADMPRDEFNRQVGVSRGTAPSLGSLDTGAAMGKVKAGLADLAKNTVADIGGLGALLSNPSQAGLAFIGASPEAQQHMLGGAALGAGAPAEKFVAEKLAGRALGPLLTKLAVGAGVWAPVGAASSVLAGRTAPGQVAASAGLAGGLGALLTKGEVPPSARPFMPPVATSERALGQMHELADAGVLPGTGIAESAVVPPAEGTMLARSPLGPVVSSVGQRLKALGPEGAQIAAKVNAVADESRIGAANVLEPFDTALHAATRGRPGVNLTPDERSAILGVLERRQPTEGVPPNVLPLLEQEQNYFARTPARASQLEVTTKNPLTGERAPFAPVPDYFPHQYNSADELKSDADLRQAIERNLLDKGQAATPEEANRAVLDYAQYVDSGGRKGGQLAMQVAARANPGATPAKLRNWLLNPVPNVRRAVGSLEFTRTVNNPFYDPRPEVVFPRHVEAVERGLSEIKHYGQDATQLESLKNALPPQSQRTAEWLTRTATESHEPPDPGMAKWLGRWRAFQLRTFTPLTTTKNFSQRVNNLLTSNVGSFLRRGVFTDPESRYLASRSGALAEGSHETLAQALGERPTAGPVRHLRDIAFSQTERGNRQTGAMVGVEDARAYANRLARNPRDPVARARLEDLQIDPDEVASQGGRLTPAQEDVASLHRSELGQFRSHPIDLPDWMTSTPLGRTLGLFKGFDYQQGKLGLQETLGRMTSGRPGDLRRGLRNLAIVGTVYPLAGEAINTLYSVILKRESPQHAAQRTQEFIDDATKVARMQMTPPEFAKKYVGRYGQDMLAGAATGTGGALVQAFGYGQGDQGGSLTKYAVGPALSRPAEAAQLAVDVGRRLSQQGTPASSNRATGGRKPVMTPAQQRQALRLVFQGWGSMAAPYLVPRRTAPGDK